MRGRVLWLLDAQGTENLSVRGLGLRERMQAGIVHRPNGTNDYLFMHFHSPVTVFAQGRLQPASPETFVIWRPGQRHQFGNERQQWLHSWMHCDGRLVRRMLEATQVPLDTPIRLQDPGLTERMLSAIDRELRGHAQSDPLILESQFVIWMRELAREGGGITSRVPERLLKARNFIDENTSRLVRLGELASVSHLSVSQFSAEFRRHFGLSPVRYASQARLRHAIHYLLNPNYSIAEAAEKTGFADLFHFSKAFKKHFGASPRAYRKRLLSTK